MKATTVLNEILEKLSVLTKEDELAQELSQEEVKSEAVLSELDSVDETTKEVEEETTELSEEVSTEEVEASSEEQVEEETELERRLCF
jgi:uncharacterized protein with HEPN domain